MLCNASVAKTTEAFGTFAYVMGDNKLFLRQ